MQTIEDCLHEWHRTLGDECAVTTSSGNAKLRKDLMIEELDEVIEAIDEENREYIAKELADLVYTAFGSAYAYDIPLEDVVKEVHRSNMTKIGPEGEVLKNRLNGKIEKPDSYKEADVGAVLERHDLRSELKAIDATRKDIISRLGELESE